MLRPLSLTSEAATVWRQRLGGRCHRRVDRVSLAGCGPRAFNSRLEPIFFIEKLVEFPRDRWLCLRQRHHRARREVVLKALNLPPADGSGRKTAYARVFERHRDCLGTNPWLRSRHGFVGQEFLGNRACLKGSKPAAKIVEATEGFEPSIRLCIPITV